MLSQPQEILDLLTKQSKQITVTQLAFPSGDVNNFVIGSEDSTIYSGNFLLFTYQYIHTYIHTYMCPL
jgi:hypothetical protein